MNSMKKTLTTLLTAAALTLGVGCTSRDDVLKDARPAPTFSTPGTISLPNEASYAQKRGFADFTGDGLTDMIEINDEAFFGQKWVGKLFPGHKKDGLLHFGKPRKFNLPINAKWFSSDTKLDTADVNGDGYADIVLTQYTQEIINDTYRIAFAMNTGDGKTYSLVEDITKVDVPIGQSILRFLEVMDADSHEDLSEWFKMDWSDMNGDGKDDLNLFWQTCTGFMSCHDLYAEVWYSSTPADQLNQVRFSGDGHVTLPDLLYHISIRGLDTEDVTGNGKADILIYRGHIGAAIQISMVENVSSGNLHFRTHKDYNGVEIEMDTFGFEKRDSFDLNGDNCADYVHAGKNDGKPSLSYLLVDCKTKEHQQ